MYCRVLLRTCATEEELNMNFTDIIIWKNAAFNYDPLTNYAEDITTLIVNSYVIELSHK